MSVGSVSAHPATLRARARDLVELCKPGITALVLCTTAGGVYLAPGHVMVWRALVVIVTTAAVVSAANALNQYLERDIDGFMERTRNRPLPARRLDAQVALGFGLAVAALALPPLFLAGGWLTGALAVVALVSYVLVYTPMKQWSPLALLVGAVPGAIPPLIGWTTVTQHLTPRALPLFAILFLWQIPHFLAIALYRKEDYARAGLRVLPVVRGDALTKRCIGAGAVALVLASLLPLALGLAGWIYGGVACATGGWFLWRALVWPEDTRAGARRLFLLSILHLSLLFIVLMLDARH
jgi:protoheme IX farnesyltransferase